MDYHIEPGWHSHPKRRRLQKRLGADGMLALLDEIHERTIEDRNIMARRLRSLGRGGSPDA